MKPYRACICMIMLSIYVYILASPPNLTISKVCMCEYYNVPRYLVFYLKKVSIRNELLF